MSSKNDDPKALNNKRAKHQSIANHFDELSDTVPFAAAVSQDHQAIADKLGKELAPYLPQLKQGLVAVPNALVRSPVFRVADKRTPRKPEVAFSLDGPGFTLDYKGPELRQDDAFVFQTLIEIFKPIRIGGVLEITSYKLLLKLGWLRCGANYSRLSETLNRLRNSLVHIRVKSGKGSVHIRFNLIHTATIDETGSGGWKLALDPQYNNMLKAGHWAKLDLSARKQLSPGLETWLANFVESMAFGKKSFPLVRIHELCGSSTDNMTRFASSIKKAFTNIKSAGLVSDFQVCKGLVHMARRTSV